jgi:hypothetical protein
MTSGQKQRPILPNITRFAQHAERRLGRRLSAFARRLIAEQLCFVKSMITVEINHAPAISFVRTARSSRAGRARRRGSRTRARPATARSCPPFGRDDPSRTAKPPAASILTRTMGAGGFCRRSIRGASCAAAAGDPVLYPRQSRRNERTMSARVLGRSSRGMNELHRGASGRPRDRDAHRAVTRWRSGCSASVPEARTTSRDRAAHVPRALRPRRPSARALYAWNCAVGGAASSSAACASSSSCKPAGTSTANLNSQLAIPQCRDTTSRRRPRAGTWRSAWTAL